MIKQNSIFLDKWATKFSQFHKLPTSNIEMHPEEIAAFEQAFEDAKELGASWESEFEAQNQSWTNEFKQFKQEGVGNGNDTKTELAEIAGRLVASVEGEMNPKFKNSLFLNFMKKLSKQELSIEGNKIVEQKAPISNENWASEFNNQQKSNWTQEFCKTSNIPKNGECSTLNAASNEFGSDWTVWASEFQEAINKGTSNTAPASYDWIKDYNKEERGSELEDSIDQTMKDLQGDWEK